MCTEKQRVANQMNAQCSTGPRSAKGKAIVAQNPVKHGLRSATAAREPRPSRNRDGSALNQFSVALRCELSPAGVLQQIVFNQIATLGWKMLRIKRIERDLIRVDRQQRRAELTRHHEINHTSMERGGLSDAALIALWFRQCTSVGSNAYVTLRRYEAGMERSFYRACGELKKLQAEARETGAPLEGIKLAEQSQFSSTTFDYNDRPGHRLGGES
jgi:hypothetical protein